MFYNIINNITYRYREVFMEKRKTVTFIGHSDCYDITEQMIMSIIEQLIFQGAYEFLSGGQGGFDRLCAYCVYKLKTKYPHIKNNLVIPYLSFNIFNKEIFDCIIYPEGFENLYFKSAIIAKNDYLIKNSSYAICYIRHHWGGAGKTYEKAKENGLFIIDI